MVMPASSQPPSHTQFTSSSASASTPAATIATSASSTSNTATGTKPATTTGRALPPPPRPSRLQTEPPLAAVSADAGSSTTYQSPTSASDIEMEPLRRTSPVDGLAGSGVPNGAGHRRRRSSLMNPVANGGGGPGVLPGGPVVGGATGGGGLGRAPSLLRRPIEEGGSNDIPEEDEEDGRSKGGAATDGAPGRDLDAEAGLLSDSDLEDLHDDEETGLTRRDRQRRREKKARNTRLDNRVAREKITAEERKEADQHVLRRLLVNLVLIGLWYLFSLSISLYNKWMFDSDRLNFPFPLFTTAMHMVVQFSLASLVLYFFPSLRPSNAKGLAQNQAQHASNSFRQEGPEQQQQPAPSEKPLMTKWFYLTRIGPCGAATGLDIGLGNMSLEFITLTFYTMCKSSALAFVLIFAFLFRLETPTWKLVAIIAAMTAGVIMMVAGEVTFHAGGFVLVISAAFFSGFRWGLTQILLLRNPATSNPFASIFYLAPIMFVTLGLIALPVEGIPDLVRALGELSTAWGAVRTPIMLLFPGTIAFAMTASEFALLQRTSVVTLSIAGIFKEVLTISVAALVFDDKLTPINISGLLVTLAAISAYNWIKIAKMRREIQASVHRGRVLQQGAAGAEGVSSSGGSGSELDNDAAEEEIGLMDLQEHHTRDDRIVNGAARKSPSPRLGEERRL